MLRRLTIAFVAAGACAEPQPEPGERAPAIVTGIPADGDPAVVAVVARRQACDEVPPILCSGVLIAPRVVVTAAHCTEELNRGLSVEVWFGNRLGAEPGDYRVVSAHATHPMWEHMPRHAGGAYDIALLRLADAAPAGVTPVPLPVSTIDLAAVDLPARAVGFGTTAPDQLSPDGIKRQGDMRVSDVTAAEVTTTANPSMTCSRDSGGPIFVDLAPADPTIGEEFVAITVAGDGACATFARNMRVDVAVVDFIQPFLDETDAIPEGWTGTIDPAAICDSPCSTSADCPAFLSCQPSPGGEALCGTGFALPAAYGVACATDNECGSGETCARLWSHGPDACRCSAPCQEIAPPEPDGCCAVTGRPHATGLLGGGLLLLAAAVLVQILFKFKS